MHLHLPLLNVKRKIFNGFCTYIFHRFTIRAKIVTSLTEREMYIILLKLAKYKQNCFHKFFILNHHGLTNRTVCSQIINQNKMF